MAQVNRQPDASAAIDHDLDYLFAAWQALPALEEEWDTWENLDRTVFDLEWGIKEDRLRDLERQHFQGLLTPAQYERYEALLRLIEKHTPILERLLAA